MTLSLRIGRKRTVNAMHHITDRLRSILPGVIHITEVKLNVVGAGNVKTARTVSGGDCAQLCSAITSLTAQVPQADFQLSLCFHPDGEEKTARIVVPLLVNSLCSSSVTELSLSSPIHHRMWDRSTIPMELPANSFNTMAGNLRHMSIESFYWLRYFTPATSFPAIESLTLCGIIVREQQTYVLQVSVLLAACGPHLQTADLRIFSEDDDRSRSLLAAPAVLCQHWTVLRKVQLAGIALRLVSPAFATLECETLIIDTRYAEDLLILCDAFRPGQAGLPNLKCLDVSFDASWPLEWPELAAQYALIRNNALFRGIRIDIRMYNEESLDWASALIGSLDVFKGELVDFQCGMYTTPAQDMLIMVDFAPIALPRCRNFHLTVHELPEWLAVEEASNRIQPAAILMRYLRLPSLEMLDLEMSSRCSGYLPAIVSALEANAFPSLTCIEGEFAREFGSDDHAEKELWECRKREFQAPAAHAESPYELVGTESWIRPVSDSFPLLYLRPRRRSRKRGRIG